MATFTTGVFPVYDLIFKIGTAGENSIDADMKNIAEMDNFSMSVTHRNGIRWMRKVGENF